jgi:intracellular sulfur oxidation DsrE/DsrF family protein
MNGKVSQSRFARRLFLARLGAGVSVAGVAAAGASAVSAQSSGDARWQPVRHEQDDWLDKIPGGHRFVFDTTTPDGMNSALLFANNYYLANQSGYGLKDSDLAVVIVARHQSTAFAYNDSIWAKYGTELSKQANFVDPKTKEPPTVNVYATTGSGSGPAGRLDSLLKRGVHLAVCQMATRAIAGTIARATGGSADSIAGELAANLLSNSHMVPAGIVVVNRAQERGYAFVYGI